MKFLVLQGPNLNWLGQREPEKYGSTSLSELIDQLNGWAQDVGVTLEHVQSNHEGVLIDAIQDAKARGLDGLLFNPAAYTHTSIALMDAILATQMPTVEVHITNVMERESFRHHSYIGLVAVDRVMGLGLDGYRVGLLKLKAYCDAQAMRSTPTPITVKEHS